jgi:hypothetical protein
MTDLARVGLDLVGTTAIPSYDARVVPARRVASRAPGAGAVLVIGNGGSAFWRRFRAHATLTGPDPLDRYTRAIVAEATRPLAALSHHYPGDVDDPLDFQALARAAGLAAPSLLGLVVHPVYGPWMALRAAVTLPEMVDLPRPADGFDPCPTCAARPCMTACPVAAVDGAGWSGPRCIAHRVAAAEHCATGCGARIACVLGPEHRYPDDALAYHQAAAGVHLRRYVSAASRR